MARVLRPQSWYTVIGCWGDTFERSVRAFLAGGPRQAEELMYREADRHQADFWVCAVLAGNVPPADFYSAYVDPRDPRNEGVAGLRPDVPRTELVEWTVLGIQRPTSGGRHVRQPVGRRAADRLMARSAAAAEGMARSHVADAGGELLVCAVFEGTVTRVDRYATFIDPDEAPPA